MGLHRPGTPRPWAGTDLVQDLGTGRLDSAHTAPHLVRQAGHYLAGSDSLHSLIPVMENIHIYLCCHNRHQPEIIAEYVFMSVSTPLSFFLSSVCLSALSLSIPLSDFLFLSLSLSTCMYSLPCLVIAIKFPFPFVICFYVQSVVFCITIKPSSIRMLLNDHE